MALDQKQIDKLRSHAVWPSLSVKQQNFVALLVETADPIQAVKATYNCKSDKSVEAFANTLLRNWKIRKVVAFMGDYNIQGSLVTRGEALQLLSERLRDPKVEAGTFTRLFQMYSEMRGWEPGVRAGRPSQQKLAGIDDVDKLVQQIEREKKNGQEEQS